MGPGRALVLTVAMVATGGTALAQPAPGGDSPGGDPTVNPYDTPAPTDDGVVVAQALVARAKQLLDAGFPDDAKQLAEEALIQSPQGDVAAEAKAIIDTADQQLGIAHPDTTTMPPPIDPPVPQVHDVAPMPPPTDGLAAGRRSMAFHGSMMGGALGAGLGLAIDYNPDTDQAGPGAAIGAAAGIGLGYFAGKWAAERYDLTAPQAGTIGSASLVGAAVGGLIADVSDVGGTTAREVGIGVSVGTVVGAAGGILVARGNKLSIGDVALIDSFAFYGLVGGLSVGAAMQPAKDEAYSLNSVIGGIGGWLIGAGLAPKIDASPRRVGRMVLGAMLGGGAPWLLYAAVKDDSTTNDERGVGLASSLGIVAGAYLGYRWSRGMGEGGSDRNKRAPAENSTPALFHRDGAGAWTVGPTVPRTAIVDGKRAWMMDLVAGAL